LAGALILTRYLLVTVAELVPYNAAKIHEVGVKKNQLLIYLLTYSLNVLSHQFTAWHNMCKNSPNYQQFRRGLLDFAQISYKLWSCDVWCTTNFIGSKVKVAEWH